MMYPLQSEYRDLSLSVLLAALGEGDSALPVFFVRRLLARIRKSFLVSTAFRIPPRQRRFRPHSVSPPSFL